MEATITIALNPEGNLELPPEIRDKFSPGEKYSVITNGDTIVFTKVTKFDWDDLRKRREQLGDDPDRLTTEEICAFAKRPGGNREGSSSGKSQEMKVVLDTNIWLSALIWGGVPDL